MGNDYRTHKKYVILNMVNHLQPVSRTKITEITDYRPASVGEITKQLLDEGLLVESSLLSVGHGRRRVMLEINKSRLCAIAIGFSDGLVRFLISQFDGTVIYRGEEPLPEDFADFIAGRVTEMIRTYSDKQIVGIGLCDPLYDPTRSKGGPASDPYSHANDWIHLELKPHLEEVTSLPVSTFSAVTMPALAEQRFGFARGRKNFICVELSNGIGSSICCNGQAISGANGLAGELGHTVIDAFDPRPEMCYCGKVGCLEHDTSFPALSDSICKALKKGVSSTLNSFYDFSRPLSVDDIRKGLDADDALCKYYVKQAATRIGIAISNAANLLNPELVVLFGFMTRLGDFFTQQIECAAKENTVSFLRGYEFHVSETLEQNILLGAAAELFSAFLHVEDYNWIYELNAVDESEAEE